MTATGVKPATKKRVNPPTFARSIKPRGKDDTAATPRQGRVISQKGVGIKKVPASAPEPKTVAVEEQFAEPAMSEEALAAVAESAKRPERYFEAVGRRKTAIARARLFTRAGDFTVNDRLYAAYFPGAELQRIAEDALKKMKLWERFRISVHVSGGGLHSQAEAVRHALARCLIKFNSDFRKRLKRAGFLKRDPRAKERKKFGLKKARRAPQWQKR